jgi:uncharacterized protein YecE (DUF72 family)
VAHTLEEQAELVWVIFNNNYSTQSVEGARGLLEVLLERNSYVEALG